MKRALQLCGRGLAALMATAGAFILWTSWLGLTLLLALQVYVITANELALPRFVLRQVEAQLAAHGLNATFTRTSFDPSGRILAENVRVSLPNFPEPILTARSVYVRVNPWMLMVGRIDPREIRVVGASGFVPAMLAPSGRVTEIIHSVDATLLPLERTIQLEQLSGRVAGVFVSARGLLILQKATTRKPMEANIRQFVHERFAALCRQALEIEQRVRQFEQPALHLELGPSESGAAMVSLTLLARGAELAQPVAVRVRELRAQTRVLLFGDNPTSWLEFSAAELHLPGEVHARGVQGDVTGRFQEGAFFFEPRELMLTAHTVRAAGVEVRALSGQVFPRPLPRLDITTVARVLDAPISIRGEIDFKLGNGRAFLTGDIAPAILTPLSERLRVDVRKFFDFTSLALERGEVRIGDGWKFQQLDARVRVDGINAYGVKMTDGRATVQLTPERFYSPDAFARVGDNFARGSYEQDLRTLEYRFLLAGRLRPLELSPWFREWWPNFFRQLEFPIDPPAAGVDVRGMWRDGMRTSVFVFADADRPILRGAQLHRVRTRLFIRPGFFDGLEIFATHGEGFARGRFTFINPPFGEGWESFVLAMDSSLTLGTIGSILGEDGKSVLAPFVVAQAPSLKLTGEFRGSGAAGGAQQKLRIQAKTTGEFRFHDFPLHDTAFTASVQDDEIVIDDFEAVLASGVVAGHARVWGKGEQRRLGFDISIDEASLGQLAGTVQTFIAQKKNLPAPTAGKFVTEKANVRLKIAASAEGSYSDPYSFSGSGNASLKGPEIAEIALLGQLSELLKFTAVRFTEAEANFKVEGGKLNFPEIKIRGSNAAIDAHGSYALERRELDFNAKIYPFQESENLIKTVVGAVLTPFSNAFEVKLGGTLDAPSWGFANLFRSPSPGDIPEKAEPGNALPANPPAPVPSPAGTPAVKRS